MAATRSRTAPPNTASATAPATATASSAATRATVLLTPEATPAWSISTAPITTAVSGGAVMAMPMPISAIGGKNVVQ